MSLSWHLTGLGYDIVWYSYHQIKSIAYIITTVIQLNRERWTSLLHFTRRTIEDATHSRRWTLCNATVCFASDYWGRTIRYPGIHSFLHFIVFENELSGSIGLIHQIKSMPPPLISNGAPPNNTTCRHVCTYLNSFLMVMKFNNCVIIENFTDTFDSRLHMPVV